MSYPTKNITIRVHVHDYHAVKRAADRAGKNLTDYGRDILLPWAYSDLGEKRPNLPPLEKGRHDSMLSQAASRAGMTPEQFARLAVESASASVLGFAPPPAEAQPESGERPATRPGAYSEIRELRPAESLGRKKKMGR